MNETDARKLLVESGKQLLETGLVARTWGNVSCRLDEKSCVITPSGLDYMKTEEKDIVKLDLETGQWHGERKPSGERGVHIAAYRAFPDAGFVIHTHQTYATAVGLAGYDSLDMTDDERQKLGGIALAGYGLSGTKKLTSAVTKALETGAQTILMVHHGVLICGRERDEAIERAVLLEEVCRRNIRGIPEVKNSSDGLTGGETYGEKLTRYRLKPEAADMFGCAEVFVSPAIAAWAGTGMDLVAQIDDMAQMIGRKIPIAADQNDAIKQLKKHSAVIIPGTGAAVRAADEDDLEAMKLLVEKACVCAVHTGSMGVSARLGRIDTALQHFIYMNKYSKQKKGN